MALQFLIRNYFRVDNVVTVRLGKSVHKIPKCAHADGCTLIHYTNDLNPDFHYYETTDTALNIPQIIHANNSRVIQCLTRAGSEYDFGDMTDIARE